jgi:hypothetical protein
MCNHREGIVSDSTSSQHGAELPPELAEFLLSQQYAALLHSTNQGTILVVKMPRYEITSVRGRVPIEIRHELYSHPAAPVIRMVTRIYDQPDSSVALETYVNVADEVQRADYAALRDSSSLLMLFYDDQVQHSLTKRVGGTAPSVIDEVLRHADQLLAAIPLARRDFDRAKADVMHRTEL